MSDENERESNQKPTVAIMANIPVPGGWIYVVQGPSGSDAVFVPAPFDDSEDVRWQESDQLESLDAENSELKERIDALELSFSRELARRQEAERERDVLRIRCEELSLAYNGMTDATPTGEEALAFLGARATCDRCKKPIESGTRILEIHTPEGPVRIHFECMEKKP